MTRDYSQWGEQAIIASLLAKLRTPDRWCVDVGAGDSIKLSNTRALIDTGYSAVLIEGDPTRYESLHRNAPPTAKTINAMVSRFGDQSLDAILARTDCPHNPDLLSIDIDGHDYHVWQSLEFHHPKIVIIEFNPTMSPDFPFIQPLDTPIGYGSSLAAIVSLGASKKYRLVAVTVTNAVFMRNDLCLSWNHSESDMRTLWNDRRFMTHIFSDYEGNMYMSGHKQSPWSVTPCVIHAT